MNEETNLKRQLDESTDDNLNKKIKNQLNDNQIDNKLNVSNNDQSNKSNESNTNQTDNLLNESSNGQSNKSNESNTNQTGNLLNESSNDQSKNELKTKLFLKPDLSLIKLKKIIDIRYNEKSAIIEGEFEEERVLIFIEKLPFDDNTINKLFNESFELNKILQNDIYGSYLLEPNVLNKMKTTIICPATDKHFEKYLRSQYVMIEETADRYEKITLPYLEENKFSIEWVYNILDHKQESERILLEDEDEKNGFILLPDLKWDGINAKKLYLVAIIRRRDIKSIRDLTSEHLELLKNIKNKSCKIIKDKYDLNSDQLQIYFHYQPSYYHLHIHFNPINYEHPRLFIGSSHLIDTVINNIEIDSNYYKKATLPFRIKCSSSLNEYYKTKLNE